MKRVEDDAFNPLGSLALSREEPKHRTRPHAHFALRNMRRWRARGIARVILVALCVVHAVAAHDDDAHESNQGDVHEHENNNESRWTLATLTDVRWRTRSDSLEVNFTLSTPWGTHAIALRRLDDLVGRASAARRQVAPSGGRRRALSSSATHTETISGSTFEVVPLRDARGRGVGGCQYAGVAMRTEDGTRRSAAAALCERYVKGQIRGTNATIAFEAVSDDAANAYLATRTMPSGLDPLAYVVFNVSSISNRGHGVIDSGAVVKGYDSVKWLNADGAEVDAKTAETVALEAKANTTNGRRRRLLSSSSQRVIEMVVVNDKKRCDQFNGDMDALEADTLFVVNVVNSMYTTAPFNPPIKVQLKEIVSFDQANPYAAASIRGSSEVDSGVLIERFNAWIESADDTLEKHDVVHLFSGEDFASVYSGSVSSGTIGLAWQYTFLDSSGVCEQKKYCSSTPEGYCSAQSNGDNHCCLSGFSGAISQVYRSRSQADAITVAHEMGHQLGFSHDQVDSDGCAKYGDIMAASATYELEVDWSSCTMSEYNAKIGDIYHECLLLSATESTSVCGNGVVEPGEACDCPDRNCTCYDHCCDGYTCQLRTNATCSATESCCDEDTCAPRGAGYVCRSAVGPCDVAETCDGTAGSCPADVNEPYGKTCVDAKGDVGACWSNQCRNRDFNCQRVDPDFHGGKPASSNCSFSAAQTASQSDACLTTSSKTYYCFSSGDSCNVYDYSLPYLNAPLGFPCDAAVSGIHANVCDGLGSCVALSSVMPNYVAPLPALAGQRVRDCATNVAPSGWTLPPPSPSPPPPPPPPPPPRTTIVATSGTRSPRVQTLALGLTLYTIISML